jgi:hypothetical protein
MRAVPSGQVYDAYVFFDINGDWHLTVVELKLMLKSLAVEVRLPALLRCVLHCFFITLKPRVD